MRKLSLVLLSSVALLGLPASSFAEQSMTDAMVEAAVEYCMANPDAAECDPYGEAFAAAASGSTGIPVGPPPPPSGGEGLGGDEIGNK